MGEILKHKLAILYKIFCGKLPCVKHLQWVESSVNCNPSEPFMSMLAEN